MASKKSNHLETFANWFEIIAVFTCIVLVVAIQLFLQESPCQLCVMQRYGLLAIALGFMLNIKYGTKPSHYALINVSSVFTALVALRQVAVTVIPQKSGLSASILGFHLYTWIFILAIVIFVLATTITGMEELPKKRKLKLPSFVTGVLFTVIVLLGVANLGTIFMECGLGKCPSTPLRYSWPR